MADNEILRRLDDHLAIANEHMARGNEHMARGNELWAENRRALDAFHAELAKNRLELREMSIRGERVTQAFLDELRELRVGFREEMQEQRGVLRDLVAESRAQRQALLAVLDRFQNGGGPAAAGA